MGHVQRHIIHKEVGRERACRGAPEDELHLLPLEAIEQRRGIKAVLHPTRMGTARAAAFRAESCQQLAVTVAPQHRKSIVARLVRPRDVIIEPEAQDDLA